MEPSHFPSFKFMSSFFTNYFYMDICLYMYVCIYIYTHIFLNITCSVHIMLLICVFPGLTIWHWNTFPRENYYFHSQLSSVACNYFCRVEALWAFPIYFGVSIGIVLVQLTLAIQVHETLWV